MLFEIPSPDDSLSSLAEKVVEYLSIGTEHLFVLDPVRRKGYRVVEPGNFVVVDAVTTTDGLVHLPCSELFREV